MIGLDSSTPACLSRFRMASGAMNCLSALRKSWNGTLIAFLIWPEEMPGLASLADPSNRGPDLASSNVYDLPILSSRTNCFSSSKETSFDLSKVAL
ncbi:hypothetical protein OGAPHI_002844 [Ogataea philodendri]|uniref:Uncharacterized protein n=1 Tax=Ogataea philodendri TaxID=1378263 RepID=A0A9P8P8Y8_9ASCO|nr:uncharacterized protein OGAPHI_002844 [Ogataea philodendri]KAH3667195.1 hypothetical protein OGAPHI_002844 [Ogataea philodendri]